MEKEIRQIIQDGENSLVEFKTPDVSPQSLAEEISAFANVRGGEIFIGISDDGRVSGIDKARIKNLEDAVMNICRNNILPPLIPMFETTTVDGKVIARIQVSEGLEKPYQTASGKYMIRVGSTKRNSSRQELLRLFQNAGVVHIDGKPVPGASKQDLDLDKIKRYFKDVYELDMGSMDEVETRALLVNASLAEIVHAKLCPSMAGLLFFSRKEGVVTALEKYLPQAGIQFVYYQDQDLEDIFDRLDCYDPSPEAIDTILHKLKLNWKTSSVIRGMKREELKFPQGVLRELLVNAVVHRDYSIHAKIQIKMQPGIIEITNPGRLINTVTIEKMKAGISISRNPIILKFMQNYRYADQLGRGIPMVFRKISAMPGFSIHLEARDEMFKARLEFSSENCRRGVIP